MGKFFRRTCSELHLWLGIISGLILFLVCLSGTILVFREEMVMLAHPQKYYVEVPAGAERIPVDDIAAQLESANAGMKVSGITIPEAANRTMTVTLTGGGHGGFGPGTAFLVNPYTGEIAAKEGENTQWGDRFWGTMEQFHRNLCITYRHESWDKRMTLGRILVGSATIIFIIVTLTGLVLWFPQVRRWSAFKQGLTVKFRSGFWKFIYDSHNSLGFYFLIPCLIMALTGLCFSFKWYQSGVSMLLGVTPRMMMPDKIEPPEAGMTPLPLEKLISLQKQLTPNPGEMTLSIPQSRDMVVTIQTGHTGFFALAVKDRTQWDRFRGKTVPITYTGKEVEVERFADKPLGVQIALSLKPLHLGDITGTSSKIFFFFACLLATLLPLTGAMLWVKKLVNRRRAVADTPAGCKERQA